MSDLRHILETRSELKLNLEAITKIADEAFEVFSYALPLSNFQDSFNKSWRKLFYYLSHRSRPAGTCLSWGWELDYRTVHNIFYDVTDARITRDDFSQKLEPIRTAVTQYIEELKTKISEQDKELEQLYDNFAQKCGEYSSLLSSPKVRELIFKDFLQI